jgi:tRNA A-37 threonylcarbamoyl transferase component Bud32
LLSPGTILQQRYEVVRQLGKGGMGAVYEATDRRLHRTVALKETLVETDDLRRAFAREARLLANLSHPALPKVIDHFGEDAGQYLVMEFVAGADLAQMLFERGRPFPLDTVLRWADELLDTLEYLHAHEPPVIHRDIKPANLKLTARERVALLDFGLAKGAAGQMTQAQTGVSVYGYTPNYAALEQIQGERTSPRSDLYSLAATLYHLLTNQAPLDALKRATELLHDENDPLRPPHEVNPEVPVAVSNVLMRALALRPTLRPQTAAELRAALRQAASGIAAPVTQAGDEATRGRLPAAHAAADNAPAGANTADAAERETMLMPPPTPSGAGAPTPTNAPAPAAETVTVVAPQTRTRGRWPLWAGAAAATVVAALCAVALLTSDPAPPAPTPAAAPAAPTQPQPAAQATAEAAAQPQPKPSAAVAPTPAPTPKPRANANNSNERARAEDVPESDATQTNPVIMMPRVMRINPGNREAELERLGAQLEGAQAEYDAARDRMKSAQRDFRQAERQHEAGQLGEQDFQAASQRLREAGQAVNRASTKLNVTRSVMRAMQRALEQAPPPGQGVPPPPNHRPRTQVEVHPTPPPPQ